ncbi:uncharacterized protein LOC141702957 [Apium graveolens]|uniref:uncharacterized protein LOC141702957 n=1 Tax=Apium graveolens TaxID=4045 RepID=UPI003D78D125
MEGQSSKPLESILDDTKGHIIHALQNALVAYEAYTVEAKKFKALEEEHKECPIKLKAAIDRASENIKTATDIQEKFDEFATNVQSLETKMKGETDKVVTQHVMKTRVEMMLEYSRGEWKNWDVIGTVKIYNYKYPDDAFPVLPPADVAVKEGGEKSAKDLDVIGK